MRNLLVSALCVLGVAACSKSSPQLSASDARDVLIDRNWMDRMPQNTTDRLHVYRFVPTMGGGVYQDRTLFKGMFELFTFTVEGDRLDIFTPEDHQHTVTGFRIDEVDGPEPFDIRLTLDRSPRGPRVFYSVRATTGDLDAELRALAERAQVR